MKEMIIKIPEDATELVTELVEKLGGTIKVEEKISSKKKKPKKKKESVGHDFLFGKWKDFDVDTRKIREELWRRD
ncbi:MAG TPA: hypothetical protein VH396_03660 [Chitinophagaceae bacterium]|jgi:hypothetical protein